ncbi:hypothetical protein GGX14DRAFT_575213 [Mycena pura]|uniref:F-box domain-containing protein n=1 Tax=Mycena pura TaxID=153505 RepID=A0AAD6UZQ7_9AGAR|nr:hypothetical protein GGX14DRAFT_575213 [Mycena pura]
MPPNSGQITLPESKKSLESRLSYLSLWFDWRISTTRSLKCRRRWTNLREKRDRLADYVAAHRALLSPIRRMPLDIIREIFLTCLPTDRNCVMSASEAPILLGRVCSLWRAISHSTPSLWARLHVALPRVQVPFTSVTPPVLQKKLVQRIETTRTWLGRTGQCPLSISVDCGCISPPIPHPLLQALLPFASQWCDIRLAISRSAFETLRHLTAADVPLLKTLKIKLSSNALRRLDWKQFGILDAPRISNFDIWGPGPEFNAQELPLRWSQLTALCLAQLSLDSPMTADAILQLISQCPGLRELKLCVPLDAVSEMHGRMIKCAFLQLLHLHCWNTGSHFVLLEHLLLPDLRTLILTGELQENVDAVSTAYFFADSPRLENVHIDRITFSKPALLDILRVLPPTTQSLEVLSPEYQSSWDDSTESHFDDEVLAALTPSLGNPAPCCPALRALAIERCNRVSDEAVLRFVAARAAAGPGPYSTLKRVQMRFRRQMQVEDMRADLRPYVEAGLDITITHLPRSFSPWQGLAALA